MPVPLLLRKPHQLKTIATQYWDLASPPRARVFEILSLNCENELEKEKLLEFSSLAGQEDLFTYVNRPRRTILEVLEDFRHATAKLTLQSLFEMFQPIKPRPFSIASSSISGKLDILVAVVEYYTNLRAQRKGICSNWLKSLNLGDEVFLSVKKGTFSWPIDPSVPIIMVGPGTGLAPFRSVLLEQKAKGSNRPAVLFFGCRQEVKDFHCKEDLKEMEKNGFLQVFTAFSRDQEDKCYVQHLVKLQSRLLKELILEKGGYFYVAGSSKNMPQSVKKSLEEALGSKDYVDKMLKDNRYQEETWG